MNFGNTGTQKRCGIPCISTTRTASAAPDLFRNDGENKGAGGGPGDGLSDAEAGAAKPKSVTASSSGGDASGYGSTAGREEEVRTAEAEGEDAAKQRRLLAPDQAILGHKGQVEVVGR